MKKKKKKKRKRREKKMKVRSMGKKIHKFSNARQIKKEMDSCSITAVSISAVCHLRRR